MKKDTAQTHIVERVGNCLKQIVYTLDENRLKGKFNNNNKGK